MVVALVAIIAAPIGLLVGTVAGYAGGWVDAVLNAHYRIFFLAFRSWFWRWRWCGTGAGHRECDSGHCGSRPWPPYARIARAETLTSAIRNHLGVKLMGASPSASCFVM